MEVYCSADEALMIKQGLRKSEDKNYTAVIVLGGFPRRSQVANIAAYSSSHRCFIFQTRPLSASFILILSISDLTFSNKNGVTPSQQYGNLIYAFTYNTWGI